MYRVLIVDDEEDVLKGIGKAVSDMHLFDEVDLESDPLAAEEAFSRKKYQVVISDICMEGEDGFEMIERIRTFSGNAKFVILTAYSDYEFMHRALKLGVDDYVLKPINKAAFTACLSKIRSELDEAQRAWKLKIYKEGAAAAELPEGEFAAIASYDAKLRKNAEGTVGASGVEILWVREESPFEYLLCGEREGCERETERLLSGVSFAAVTPTAAGDGLGKLRRELYGALQYRPFLQSGVVRTDRRAERTEWGTYRGYLESLKRLFSEGVHGMEVPEKLLSGSFPPGWPITARRYSDK